MISCFQLKPYVKCFSNLFKMLKKLVVELKTAQSVEPDEELVSPHLNRSRYDRGPMVTCQALNAND